MSEIQLGVIEARYADMIWEHEPVSSSELVKMTAVEFNWKRTTAHNVLRRLIDKGLFKNENGLVTAVISREEFYSRQSKKYVQETFAGSLPAFIAAFTQNTRLTAEEAEAIHEMIDRAEETE
ncbi:MAG: BlaI/MecI/CopY family transcriptional regulator [Eubacterium sp.]|nr:BlaI/MecI/CopY family transcriptional regulator [Eubacterium sp.]MCM1216848.1 BlaI/MecI/CopY family transcriptional regulator [Lachnospiraceae bacterium]MCM1240593.1 BlaI/MecI/CopY family transcriptional regulator [Lachnospiraceae bacterium]MCM1411487.1 BlaI/MecI/CopY family transcriptional regulator [Lachnospiraceae bacterium]